MLTERNGSRKTRRTVCEVSSSACMASEDRTRDAVSGRRGGFGVFEMGGRGRAARPGIGGERMLRQRSPNRRGYGGRTQTDVVLRARNQSYGSGLRGIQLFFTTLLMAIGGIELFFQFLW